MNYKIFHKIDIGNEREHQEDNFLRPERQDNGIKKYITTNPVFSEEKNMSISSDDFILAIADGLGGLKAGDEASRLAVTSLFNIYKSKKPGFFKKLVKAEKGFDIAACVGEVHNILKKKWEDDDRFTKSSETPATTLTACFITPQGLCSLAHVGDSRFYILRDGKLEQKTQDHTHIAHAMREYKIGKKEASNCYGEAALYQALGSSLFLLPGEEMQRPNQKVLIIDKFSFELKESDRILLCTDGLNSMVSDEDIKKILASNPIEDVCNLLIGAANKNGGKDNITVIVMEVNR